MKFKIILILLFFLCSCTNYSTSNNVKLSYSGKGFAYIYSEDDYIKKITKKKFNNELLVLGSNNLKIGTLIRITNPDKQTNITAKIIKRTEYPEFYKILITEAVAEKLQLNKLIPFVEIEEIKKNKSFIAKKSKIFTEEKKIPNNAPVDKVKIDNISLNQIVEKKKIRSFTLIIAEFYNLESASTLKNNISKELTTFNNKKLSIIKKKKNSYQLISGPYKAINSLKNDYINIKNYGFEELEVKSNE